MHEVDFIDGPISTLERMADLLLDTQRTVRARGRRSCYSESDLVRRCMGKEVPYGSSLERFGLDRLGRLCFGSDVYATPLP